MRKIKVVMKRPGSPPYVTNVSDRLENLQNIVGGPIECICLANNLIMVCNEEGKLMGLDDNFRFTPYGEMIVGTVFFVGANGEDFDDCPLNAKELREMFSIMGVRL